MQKKTGPIMSKADLVKAANDIIAGNLKDRSTDQIKRLMTVSQYVTDLCLNEIERRGELSFYKGAPVLPYECAYGVDTILTRPTLSLSLQRRP
jgi:hypothetical protein